MSRHPVHHVDPHEDVPPWLRDDDDDNGVRAAPPAGSSPVVGTASPDAPRDPSSSSRKGATSSQGRLLQQQQQEASTTDDTKKSSDGVASAQNRAEATNGRRGSRPVQRASDSRKKKHPPDPRHRRGKATHRPRGKAQDAPDGDAEFLEALRAELALEEAVLGRMREEKCSRDRLHGELVEAMRRGRVESSAVAAVLGPGRVAAEEEARRNAASVGQADPPVLGPSLPGGPAPSDEALPSSEDVAALLAELSTSLQTLAAQCAPADAALDAAVVEGRALEGELERLAVACSDAARGAARSPHASADVAAGSAHSAAVSVDKGDDVYTSDFDTDDHES